MKTRTYFVALLCIALFSMCKSDDDARDTTPPEIGGDAAKVNPIDCQIYHPGETIRVYYELTDDTELGSYEIEIHDNFQPHTHSAVAVRCPHLTTTATVYPWTMSEAAEIPASTKKYTIQKNIVIPTDRDLGDYHFELRVTDRTGWTTEKSVDIKIYPSDSQLNDEDAMDEPGDTNPDNDDDNDQTHESESGDNDN